MRKYLICVFGFWFLIFTCLSLPCRQAGGRQGFSYAGMLDKVIVVVNGETITQAELDSAVASILEKLKMEFSGEELAKKLEETRKEILDRMIEERLILSEAKKKDVKVEAGDIEGRIKDVKSKFDSEERFNEVLKEQNVSLNELKQRYADQTRVERLIELEVRKKIIVSPSEVLEYYNAHKEEFKEPEQVKLKNILIKVEGEIKSDKEAQRLAEKLLGFLKAGESFDETALKYSKGPNASNGGNLGLVKKGQMLAEIDEAVFKLESGQISEVVKTSLGYHIFKVEEKRPERVKSLDEVKNDIESALFYQKGKKRYNEWIADLKKNAYISFR